MRDRILGPYRGYYLAITSLLMGELGNTYRGWGKLYLTEPDGVLDPGELETFHGDTEHRTVEAALDEAEERLVALADALPEIVAAPPQSESLHGLLYVSRAREHIEVPRLQHLLARARERNARVGITGVLLYFDETFMQYIEGPRAPLELAYRRIRKDPLHEGLIKCMHSPVAERCFASWSMAFSMPEMELWAAPDPQGLQLPDPLQPLPVRGMLSAFLARHSARSLLLRGGRPA